MKFDLHTHTHYSYNPYGIIDALDSPEEMVKRAKEIGLDGIAFTDHNTIKVKDKFKELSEKYGVFVLLGEEVLTNKGEVIALGINEVIKEDMSLLETIDKIHEQGGLAIAPHPFNIFGKGTEKNALKADCIEIFNSLSLDRISNNRNKKLAIRHNRPAVVGSDAHMKEMLGYGITDIKCEPDIDSILRAIRKRQVSFETRYTPLSLVQEWFVRRVRYNQINMTVVKKAMNKNLPLEHEIIIRLLFYFSKKQSMFIDKLLRTFGYYVLARSFASSSYAMFFGGSGGNRYRDF